MEIVKVDMCFGIEFLPNGTFTLFCDVDGRGTCKISLKNVKWIKGIPGEPNNVSEYDIDDLIPFTADIYINGKKGGDIKNFGNCEQIYIYIDDPKRPNLFYDVIEETKIMGKDLRLVLSDLGCSTLDFRNEIKKRKKTWEGYDTYEGKKALIVKIANEFRYNGCFWS